MMDNNNLDQKEIKEKLVNELEDVKMDEKLEWRILGQFRSMKFAIKGGRKIKTKLLVGLAAGMCAVVILTLGLFAYSQSTAFKSYLKDGFDNSKITLGIIPTVDSESKLISLLKSNSSNGNDIIQYYDSQGNITSYGINGQNFASRASESIVPDSMKSAVAGEAAGIQNDSSISSDYSKTNTQVEGVDEGDIVKTDGKYIYRLSNNQNISLMYDKAVSPTIPSDSTTSGSSIIAPGEPGNTAPDQNINTNKISIIEALPDGKLKAISEIKIDVNQAAMEFYVDASTISVVLNGGQATYNGESKQITQVMIYGITDITKPDLLKNYQIEGSYLSSRKISSQIYLITNKYIYNYNGSETVTSQMKPPVVCDNKADKSFTDINLKAVQYFPDETYQTYVNISAIDTSKPKQDAKITTYLSSGQNIYSSLNNLYIANVSYDQSVQTMRNGMRTTESLDVYKFSLDNGSVVYKAKAEKIPGFVLNQYSMDEYNGSFRIAVTSGTNSLLVFDSNMKKTGEITDMAKGEQIKSVRFMGDKGYVVTFRQTDPLFVIDLSNPATPKVLGQLKIPGFSEYLHPYDENHIIGVGKSASDQGRVNGIKMSMFDITDPVNPKEMFSRDIGEGLINPINTIGQNPKAFLFDKEKGIIALPVSSYETVQVNAAGAIQPAESAKIVDANTYYVQQTKYTSYLHIYSVDLKNGFVLKAKLIANNPDEILSRYQPEDSRALYIKDKFFTTTGRVIKSFDYMTFNQIDTLSIAG